MIATLNRKIFPISERLFADLLREDRAFRIVLGAPGDAVFAGVTYDFTRASFLAAFDHPSFPETAEGQVLPVDGDVRIKNLTLCERCW